MISGEEAIGLLKKVAVYVIAALLLMLVSGLLGGIVGYNRGKAGCQGMEPDTTTIVTTDTLSIQGTAVRPDADSLIRIDSVPYPVPIPYPVPQYVDGDTIIIHDTVAVYLAREHRLFSIQDTLDVWYSGIDPKIDSINLYYHHTTEIIKQPYEVARMPRLTLDVGAAAFYTDNSINPCLVGEMRYNAKHTTFSAFGAVNHKGEWGAGIGVTYRMNLIK